MSFKPGHPNHSSPHPTTILHKFAAIHPTTVLRSIHSEKSKTTNKIRNESKGRREQHHTHTHTETSRKELKAGKSKAAPPPLQRATVGTIKKKGKATGITQNKHRQTARGHPPAPPKKVRFPPKVLRPDPLRPGGGPINRLLAFVGNSAINFIDVAGANTCAPFCFLCVVDLCLTLLFIFCLSQLTTQVT